MQFRMPPATRVVGMWIAVLVILVQPGPAAAVSVKTYEEFIKKDDVLKSVYLWGVVSTAQIAAAGTRLYCLPDGKYYDTDFAEAVIDAGIEGLKRVGRFSPDLPVELIFLEAMRRKYACPPER